MTRRPGTAARTGYDPAGPHADVVRVAPGPGQESVWDYPRPPRVEPCRRHVRVEVGGRIVAESDRALRVLETAGAPAIYVPAGDVLTDVLEPARGTTECEWKGTASYFHVSSGGRLARRAAWTYERPNRGYESIAGHFSFYPARVDVCLLGGERVRPQEGGFYGGWVTDDIVGPIKGAPGTQHW